MIVLLIGRVGGDGHIDTLAVHGPFSSKLEAMTYAVGHAAKHEYEYSYQARTLREPEEVK